MPCNSAKIDMLIKGVHIQFIYENKNIGKRSIYLDGRKLETFYDTLMQTEKAYICNETLYDNAKILVCD